MAKGMPYKCIKCQTAFSEEDAANYTFFKATRLCFACYEQGQNEDHAVWCFGKRDVKNAKGKVTKWAYKKDREECARLCPDRKICLAFQWRNVDGERVRKIDQARAKRGVTD